MKNHPTLIRTLSAIGKLGVADSKTLAQLLKADVHCTRVTITRYQAKGYIQLVNSGHIPLQFRLSQQSADLLGIAVPAPVQPVGIVESAKRQPNSVFQLGSL